MDFGYWESGIFDTAHDNFIHSAESGFVHISYSLYGSHQLKEQEKTKV